MPAWRREEIAYCANVHPGITADDIANNIRSISSEVRRELALPQLQLGMWVCESALDEYQEAARLNQLIKVLTDEHLSVVTLNGFPQGNFHQAVVKHRVYHPRWSEPARLAYTKKLAVLLAKILPGEVQEGTISTLPLAYRLQWNSDLQKQSCLHLCEYVNFAKALHEKTGKRIRLCLEMEPGCVLQRTGETLEFFTVELAGYARQFGLSEEDAQTYLGLCFDICHQAVMLENIADSVRALHAAGITIGKIQVSSALQVALSPESLNALRLFAEPKYLHQVMLSRPAQTALFFDDLSEALAEPEFSSGELARVHFHLPIQDKRVTDGEHILPGMSSTQDAILELLDLLSEFPSRPHLEIETYTWQVLPEYQKQGDKPSLIKGLSAEHRWLSEEMRKRNLLCGD